MTMHPDPWPPARAHRLILHVVQTTPRRAVDADPIRPALNRDDLDGMGAAAWSAAAMLCLMAALAVLLVWVFLW